MGLWELVSSLRRDLGKPRLSGGAPRPPGGARGGMVFWVGLNGESSLGEGWERVLGAQARRGTAEVRLAHGWWDPAGELTRGRGGSGRRLGEWGGALGIPDLASRFVPSALGSITFVGGDEVVCGGWGSLRLWCLGARAAVGVRRGGMADLGWLCGLVEGTLGEEGRGTARGFLARVRCGYW